MRPSAVPGPPPLHWVKPPQQERSQKTLQRVLDAAEAVIVENGLAALTVSEVVRRAGSSVGAFYARFPDKNALLSTLHDRSCGEARATAELALDPERWAGTDVGKMVFEVTRFTAARCVERRELLIAFITLSATDPAYAERRKQTEETMTDLLHVFFRARSADIGHPDLRLAAFVSTRMILGVFEYGAIFHGLSADELDRFADELARAVLAYLGVKHGNMLRSL
jgi:AcrR family transcriptional regulator